MVLSMSETVVSLVDEGGGSVGVGWRTDPRAERTWDTSEMQ